MRICRADADAQLVRVVVDNLLANAWKFTSKVPYPRVEVGTVEHESGRSFFVRDNGAGFDMAFANKLFAPFQRLHTVAEFPGTGIGLATVQRIVHRHGGRMWAEGAGRPRRDVLFHTSRTYGGRAGMSALILLVEDSSSDEKLTLAAFKRCGVVGRHRRRARRRRRARLPLRDGTLRRPGAAAAPRGRAPRSPPAAHRRLRGPLPHSRRRQRPASCRSSC